MRRTKARDLKLPAELAAYLKAGHTTFVCADGDWDVHLKPREKSPFHDELPARALMIAENGCGDCLFLKTSPNGVPLPKVFVFWHEEDRREVFAKHVKNLTVPFQPAPAPADPLDLLPPITLTELETALASTDWRVRHDAFARFRRKPFGLEALPVLRKALVLEDMSMVIQSAECIGKLGPAAATPDDAVPTGTDKVEFQLMYAGAKVWSGTGCPNCYGTCLEALLKLKFKGDYIVDFVLSQIGLDWPDQLIRSLNALKTVGSPRALEPVRHFF
jgi:hypothetical protein